MAINPKGIEKSIIASTKTYFEIYIMKTQKLRSKDLAGRLLWRLDKFIDKVIWKLGSYRDEPSTKNQGDKTQL